MPSQPNKPDKPDLHFDIDALFDHMVTNLEYSPEDEKEWSFTFRGTDLDKLTRIAESLSEDFDVHLQEEVETHENDRVFMGPPLLAVIIVASLQPAEVKSLSARFADLAAEESITYEGVGVCDPIDMDELMDWLDLEGACWRLRAFTDSGLEPGAEIPFVFAIATDDLAGAEATAAALAKAGFDRTEAVDSEEEGTGVFVHCEGRNDEALLTSTYNQIDAIAQRRHAELIGVQFFEDDD